MCGKNRVAPAKKVGNRISLVRFLKIARFYLEIEQQRAPKTSIFTVVIHRDNCSQFVVA